MTGFIVACAPYIPRFLDQLFKKKRTGAGYPINVHSTYNGTINSTKDSQSTEWPNNSFTALNEQEEMPFDGAIKMSHQKHVSQPVS